MVGQRIERYGIALTPKPSTNISFTEIRNEIQIIPHLQQYRAGQNRTIEAQYLDSAGLTMLAWLSKCFFDIRGSSVI